MDLMITGWHSRVYATAEEMAIAADMVGLRRSGPAGLPMQRRRWSVLRSPFRHKKSAERSEMRIFKYMVRLEGPATKLRRFMAYALDQMDPMATLQVTEHQYLPVAAMYSFCRPAAPAPSLLRPARNAPFPSVNRTVPERLLALVRDENPLAVERGASPPPLPQPPM